MKKFWKKHKALIIILIVAAVFVAAGLLRKAADPHAGHDHANDPHTQQSQNADPHAGHDHSNYKVEQSYTVTTDENGRYSVQVRDPHGQAIYKRGGLLNRPTGVKVSDSVLMLGDLTASAYGSRWAVFCDVMAGKTSQTYTGCLAAQGSYLAYATNQDNAWQVHVVDGMNPKNLSQSYTLEGASAPDNRQVISKAEMNADGALRVTYWAGTTEKTTVISMPQN